jgi:hypothetical protein
MVRPVDLPVELPGQVGNAELRRHPVEHRSGRVSRVDVEDRVALLCVAGRSEVVDGRAHRVGLPLGIAVVVERPREARSESRCAILKTGLPGEKPLVATTGPGDFLYREHANRAQRCEVHLSGQRLVANGDAIERQIGGEHQIGVDERVGHATTGDIEACRRPITHIGAIEPEGVPVQRLAQRLILRDRLGQRPGGDSNAGRPFVGERCGRTQPRPRAESVSIGCCRRKHGPACSVALQHVQRLEQRVVVLRKELRLRAQTDVALERDPVHPVRQRVRRDPAFGLRSSQHLGLDLVAQLLANHLRHVLHAHHRRHARLRLRACNRHWLARLLHQFIRALRAEDAVLHQQFDQSQRGLAERFEFFAFLSEGDTRHHRQRREAEGNSKGAGGRAFAKHDQSFGLSLNS